MNAVLTALHRSQAIIEFALDGTILTANQNYLDALGFTLAEIEGRHHSMFLPPGEELQPEYRVFWEGLRLGRFQSAEFRRVAKGGRDVWIQASYNPVLGPDGRPFKVVKLATEITALKRQSIENRCKIEAIDKSQAVIEFAMDGTIITANDNFLKAVGYRLEEIVGRHHRLFVATEEQDTAAYRTFWNSLRSGRHQAAEYRRIGKGGRIVWIQASYNPILDLAGDPVKIVKFATDVTEEVARREQIRLLSLVADATSNSVIITDVEGRIEYVNAGFAKMTGYNLNEVRGRTPGKVLQGPETSQATRNTIRERLACCQPFCGEILNYTRKGEPYWTSLFINPVTGEDGRVNRFVAIQSDVTERKAIDARIAFMAHHDALTGLGNRTLFHARLSEAWQQGHPIAVLCLDLDRFKQVNDTFGHAGGDDLLRAVAARLLDCLRPTDTVARLGGDEFAVIYDEVDSEDAIHVTAQRIIDRIGAPFQIENRDVFIGVSIGIAITGGPDLTPELLVQQADRALYAAKHAGRGVYRQFEPAMSGEPCPPTLATRGANLTLTTRASDNSPAKSNASGRR